MSSFNNSFVSKYGPWALITGASSGFGELFADRLASFGLNVVLVARRSERLVELAQSLESKYGIQAKVVVADLADIESVKQVAKKTESLEIGLLVNNAGFTNNGDFLDNDFDAEMRLVDVNCRSVAALAHLLGNPMRKRGRGGMIFSASAAGFSAIPFWANYSASKGYDLILAEALHNELKPHGIDVLAMCPGATVTEFADFEGPVASAIAMQPATVVDGALEALGKQRTWVAGLVNKSSVFAMRFFPRKLNSIVASTLIRNIVKH